MKAPTRALIVEDIESWVYMLDRAARRAGASEVVVCENLQAVNDALRHARFDVAILDVGLDPDDDLNSDGIRALEAIRKMDGGGTRCILVTGWRGDRMDLQADAQQRFGVDWAYMKEKYEAHTVIAKLTELLEQAPERRLSQTTPMHNLCADMEPWRFESLLIDSLSPKDGMPTLYSLVSRLLSSAIPVIAMHPAKPIEKGPAGYVTACTGAGRWLPRSLLAWRRLAGRTMRVRSPRPGTCRRAASARPHRDVRERNVQGRLWELPGVDRDDFPG